MAKIEAVGEQLVSKNCNDDYSTHGYVKADAVFPKCRGGEFLSNDCLCPEEDTGTSAR